MFIELMADIAKLGFFIACAYTALHIYARRRKPYWVEPLAKRRLAVIGAFTLIITAIMITEAVVRKDSGPLDKAMLWMIRDNMNPALTWFFQLVTLSGSSALLIPAALLAAMALWIHKRRFEALLLLTSVLTAKLLVHALKIIIGRERPDLWEAQWYADFSFPSGHTIGTASFSIAAVLCLARIWPRFGKWAMAVAILWTCLVAVSRLVLGVHWPSDVMAAMCIGSFIPLVISLSFDLRRPDSGIGK